MYVIAEHIPMSIGYKWQNTDEVETSFTSFCLDCLKRFARYGLQIETEDKINYNKKMINNK